MDSLLIFKRSNALGTHFESSNSKRTNERTSMIGSLGGVIEVRRSTKEEKKTHPETRIGAGAALRKGTTLKTLTMSTAAVGSSPTILCA